MNILKWFQRRNRHETPDETVPNTYGKWHSRWCTADPADDHVVGYTDNLNWTMMAMVGATGKWGTIGTGIVRCVEGHLHLDQTMTPNGRMAMPGLDGDGPLMWLALGGFRSLPNGEIKATVGHIIHIGPDGHMYYGDRERTDLIDLGELYHPVNTAVAGEQG